MENSTNNQKKKAGRPKKKEAEIRNKKVSVFISKSETLALEKMMEATGKEAADLFRHGLFGKGLKIPKARLAPPELMEMLTDFKRKSSMLQYFSNKERDFTQADRNLLVGSSNSLRMAIERFQRSVFLSLNKSDNLEQLDESLAQIARLRRKLKQGEKPLKSDIEELESWLSRANKILIDQYRYLSMEW